MSEEPVVAWRVHDSGLVAVPSRFRRLGGRVRHLQGQGDPWPDTVTLCVVDGHLEVSAPSGEVGRWRLADVTARRIAAGPPVTFTVEVPGGSHLVAAAAGAGTDSLLATLLG